MAGYVVYVCDLCTHQVDSPGALLRFTVPLRTDPTTGEARGPGGGCYDHTLEVCLRCVQTRHIRRLVETAIVKTARPSFDEEPRGDAPLVCAERAG